MGPRATVMWGVIAIALGAALFATPRDDTASAARARTLALDPASLQGIVIRRDGERVVAFERAGALGGVWVAEWDTEDGAVRWLADAAAVRAAISLVRTSTLGERQRESEAGGLVGPVTEVEFISDGAAVQTSQRLRFAGDTVAGQTAIELDGAGLDRPVALWAGSDMTRVWVRRDISEWLDGGVMARLLTRPGAGGPGRVSIGASGISTTLVRGPNGWRIDEPVIARADVETVQRTIDLLSRVAASDLVWEGGAADGSAAAVLQASSGDGAATSWSIEVSVVGAGSADESRVDAVMSAQIDGKPFGPLRASVIAEPLTKVSPDAETYLPRRSASFGRAEVVGVVVRGPQGRELRRAERTIDGWEADDRLDASLAESCVDLLTSEEASRVELAKDGAARPGVQVSLLGRRGLELGTWRLEPSGRGISSLERLPAGGVIERGYEGPVAADVARWVRESLSDVGL